MSVAILKLPHTLKLKVQFDEIENLGSKLMVKVDIPHFYQVLTFEHTLHMKVGLIFF